MKSLGIAMAVLIFLAGPARAADGLVAVKSAHGVKETLDRFEVAAKGKGLNIFLRLDHAAGAKKVGKTLRPTELLVFGNPQGGTPLMVCAQTAGIDLPLKALVWEDENGKVWVSYNTADFLRDRHSAQSVEKFLKQLTERTASFVNKAIE